MGLKMNIAKTKVMVVDNTPIHVNNVLIENAQGYVYLGQHYSLKEKNQDKEIQRRIIAGWTTYAKHRDIFKSNLAICLKRQVYNSCVLPAMIYGAETLTLTKQPHNKLAVAQTKIVSMLPPHGTPHTHYNTQKLEMVQRRAARYGCNRWHNTSGVTGMLSQLEWVPLATRRANTRLCMMHRVAHTPVGDPWTPWLTFAQRTTRGSLRGNIFQYQHHTTPINSLSYHAQ